MKKRIARRVRPVALMALGALMFAMSPGCGDSTVVSESTPTTFEKTPNHVERTRRGEAAYFAPGNPYVDRSIDELFARGSVSTVVESFEESGFELRRDESFVVEESGPDGDARVAILALPPVAPGISEMVLIACVEQNGKLTIAPAALRSSPGAQPDDYLQVADNLWVSRAPLGPAMSVADVERVDDGFWNRVLDCIDANATPGIVACYVTCAWAVIEYPVCVITCVATQFTATFIKCYLQVNAASPLKPRVPTIQ